MTDSCCEARCLDEFLESEAFVNDHPLKQVAWCAVSRRNEIVGRALYEEVAKETLISTANPAERETQR